MRRGTNLLAALLLAAPVALSMAGPADARDGPLWGRERWPPPQFRPASMTLGPDKICTLISDAAALHGLQPDFFARLIWKESRFDIRALSPVGAQGIAQFMPETARIRGLADPWDPRQAIPASAHFLADLKARFGNFGLAAAAYNGGPERVARWLVRGGNLPGETVDYVRSITFRPVEWFRTPGREVETRPLEKGKSFAEACAKLPVMATRALASAPSAPWGVVVAGGISRRAALRAFNRARSRYRRVIGGQSAIIIRHRRATRARYTARVGAVNRRAAIRLCARIKRIGGHCTVRRN